MMIEAYVFDSLCNKLTSYREQDPEYSHLPERLESKDMLIYAEGCPHWEGMAGTIGKPVPRSLELEQTILQLHIF